MEQVHCTKGYIYTPYIHIYIIHTLYYIYTPYTYIYIYHFVRHPGDSKLKSLQGHEFMWPILLAHSHDFRMCKDVVTVTNLGHLWITIYTTWVYMGHISGNPEKIWKFFQKTDLGSLFPWHPEKLQKFWNCRTNGPFGRSSQNDRQFQSRIFKWNHYGVYGAVSALAGCWNLFFCSCWI